MFDDSNENNDLINNGDEFVDSSFMVSFKANESTSVSDKIKEGNSSMDDLFKDEFDDFDFDPSKSAFKPLNNTPSTPASPSQTPSPVAPFSSIEVPKTDDSAFSDADLDFNEFASKSPENKSEQNIFSAGIDLDFAASTNSNSAFGLNKEDLALDIEADKEAINPFKPIESSSGENTQSSESKEPAEAGSIKTYGKVSSGVNAFARQKPSTPAPSPFINNEPKPSQKAEDSKVEQKPVASSPFVALSPADNEEKPSPFVNNQSKNIDEVPVVKPAPLTKPVQTEKAQEASPFIQAQTVKAEEEAPSPFVKKGQTNRPVPPTSNVARVAPASSSSSVKAASSTRPGEDTGKTTQKTTHSASANIAPVQVNKKQSKKMAKSDKPVKENGKGGLIGLIIVLVVIFVFLWVADNYKKWFGSNSADTSATTQVTAVATTEETEQAVSTEATTVAATEATTVAATEETTVATTESTIIETTAETSEETTVETTEETTTATTTTEATTTTTRAPSTTNEVHASYSIANPRATSDGFHFDIAVNNTGDSSFSVSQLDHLDISFNTSSTITSLTSDYFTFTPGDTPNSFVGTPRSGSFPAGETTNVTITATTEHTVQHFYISNFYFEWN